MVPFLLLALVVLVLILIKVRRVPAEVQRAVATETEIDIPDEATFEAEVLEEIQELNPEVVSLVEYRRSHLNAERFKLQEKHNKCNSLLLLQLNNLLEQLGRYKRLSRDKKYRNIKFSLEMSIISCEPLRFFRIVESNTHNFGYYSLYNLLIDKKLEDRFRDQFQAIAVTYCLLEQNIVDLNQVNDDLASLNAFIKSHTIILTSLGLDCE